MKKKIIKYFPLIIFLINLIFYSIFNYGGFRISDSEIVFRTTESLALRNSFSVPKPLDWTYWGLGPGIDHKHYSIFGPSESILAVPFLKFAYFLKEYNLVIDSNYIPISFHVPVNNYKGAGIYFIKGERPPIMEGQYERFIVSFFNSIIGAISGVFFYFVLLRISDSKSISFITTFIYSFSSLIFPYTETFFSEPLCTLFIILSFLFIVKNEKFVSAPYEQRNYFYSGLFLGLAVTTHITAVLSIPFYYMFILGQKTKEKFNPKRLAIASLYFTLGLFIFSCLLLYYNYARFGNIFETGRSADPLYHYAIYSNPLVGLYGLLVSPGKGLFIYSPIVFLSIILWKSFHKSYKHLSIAVLGMIIIRLFFIASRSDWHGGFGIGPRYLVIIMPFLFIPIAISLKQFLIEHRTKAFLLLITYSFLCIAQQIYFNVGEIFSYLHIILTRNENISLASFNRYPLYFNWEYCPVPNLLEYNTGPFLLKNISNNNYLLWFLLTTIFLIIFTVISITVYKAYNIKQPQLISTDH